MVIDVLCYHPEGLCHKCPHPELCPDKDNVLRKEAMKQQEIIKEAHNDDNR